MYDKTRRDGLPTLRDLNPLRLERFLTPEAAKSGTLGPRYFQSSTNLDHTQSLSKRLFSFTSYRHPLIFAPLSTWLPSERLAVTALPRNGNASSSCQDVPGAPRGVSSAGTTSSLSTHGPGYPRNHPSSHGTRQPAIPPATAL